MAINCRWQPLICIAILVLPLALGQFGFGGPKGPEAKAVRSDIPFIKCEVCEHLAKQAYRQAGAFKKAAAEKKMKHERKVPLSGMLNSAFVPSRAQEML